MKLQLKIYAADSRSGKEEIKDIFYIMFIGPDKEGKEGYMVHTKDDRVPQYLVDGTWGEIIYK